MRRWTAGLGASAALALLVASVVLGQAGQRGTEITHLPAIGNFGPRGLAAAAELLRSTGTRVERRAPGDPAAADAAVIVLAAPAAALQPDEVASLESQAARGATVVIALGRGPQPALLDALGLQLAPGIAPRVARGLAPHRLMGDLALPARAASLSSARPGTLAVSGERGWTSALSIPVGLGEVLVLSGPEPLENAHLAEADAATLVLRLAALGKVAFDERFLALPGAAPPASRRALLVLAAQLLLAGATLVLARGRRLGAIRPPLPLGAGRTARDYLASLAALYRRAGAEQELAAEAWHGLRRRLERRAGLPARLTDAQAARRVAGRSPQAALALARGSAALAGGGRGVLLRVTRAAADAEGALAGGRLPVLRMRP